MFFLFDLPPLRLRYEAENSLTASDISQILIHTSRSFERFAQSRFRRPDLTLVIEKIERGSLTIEFIVAGAKHAAETVYANKDIIFGFTGFLSSCVAISQNFRPGKNKALETRLIEALINPILKGDADRVTIGVQGDDQIDLDRIAADRIKQIQRDASQSLMTQQVTIDTSSPDTQVQMLQSRPRHLTLEGRWGTVLDVKGRLYVRLEGEEGVLNPLQLTPDVSVQDGEAYRFDGLWEGRSYRITAAKPLSEAQK